MTGQHVSDNPFYAGTDRRRFARDVRCKLDAEGLSTRKARDLIRVPLTAVSHARRGQPIPFEHMCSFCVWLGRNPLDYWIPPDGVSRGAGSTCDSTKQFENKQNSQNGGAL